VVANATTSRDAVTTHTQRVTCWLLFEMLSFSMVPFDQRHGKTFRLRHFFFWLWLINIVFFLHLLNCIASLGYI
jgi:hypothetical protein